MFRTGKKHALSTLLDRSGLLALAGMVSSPCLIGVNYHRIYAGKVSTPYDRGVFGPSTEEFRQQMVWLKSHFRILSEPELVAYAAERKPFTEPLACVTFDDAYIDCYELAAPILSSLSIPAMLFVPTGMIETRSLGWWDLISYFVRKTAVPAIEIHGQTLDLDGDRNKALSIGRLLNIMKTEKEEHYQTLLDSLSTQCDVPPPSLQEQGRELMSWDQVKDIRRFGIAIGSHAHSHKVLSTIDEAEQRNELLGSKRILEDILGSEVQSLAYPVGGHSSFSETTKRHAAESGYKMAFSFTKGINRTCIHDPYAITRLAPPSELPLFRATLTLPKIFL